MYKEKYHSVLLAKKIKKLIVQTHENQLDIGIKLYKMMYKVLRLWYNFICNKTQNMTRGE